VNGIDLLNLSMKD